MRWQLVIFWLGLGLGLGLGLVATAPVKWRRQVVAPTWLLGPTIPPSSQASRVVVTQQNLREVAALRAQIQKAVNEDTFVVAAPPSQVSFLKRILGIW
ncbi:hypothetical protein KR067_008494, partial [Drosophila pandora]